MHARRLCVGVSVCVPGHTGLGRCHRGCAQWVMEGCICPGQHTRELTKGFLVLMDEMVEPSAPSHLPDSLPAPALPSPFPLHPPTHPPPASLQAVRLSLQLSREAIPPLPVRPPVQLALSPPPHSPASHSSAHNRRGSRLSLGAPCPTATAASRQHAITLPVPCASTAQQSVRIWGSQRCPALHAPWVLACTSPPSSSPALTPTSWQRLPRPPTSARDDLLSPRRWALRPARATSNPSAGNAMPRTSSRCRTMLALLSSFSASSLACLSSRATPVIVTDLTF
mmetsp:Transcript_20246/g.26818  ORF Transcript_20246/g.26818 Transcript_20246/m.26818 type:complete len:282 (-) Transcript_20246:570-1415(-)